MLHTAEHSLLTSQCHAAFPSHQASHLICVSFNPSCSCFAISGLLRWMLSYSFHIAVPSVHFWSCKSNMIRGTWGLYSWLWSTHLLQWQIMYLYYRPCPGLINQSFPSLNILTTKEINVEKTWSCTRHLRSAFLGSIISYTEAAKRSNTTFFILT